MRFTHRHAGLSAAVALCLAAPAASAHVDLLEPEARAHGTAASNDPMVDENAAQKSGPCGQQTNMRTERVARYAPGETITLRVREETPHESYIRVSIDLSGDDFPLRPATSTPPESQEAALAAEEAIGGDTLLGVFRETNNTSNFVHEIEVTLPNETCDACTLQVIQFMYNAGNPFYFQCADIVISEDGGAADAGAEPEGNAGAGGSTMPGGAGSGATDGGDAEDGGCGLCGGRAGAAPATLMGLLALALAAASRRRARA